MGGSSDGGDSGGGGGGGGGGDNKATPKAKKATPKAKKKSNGSSKYFKSTSTPKAKTKDTGRGRGDQSYDKQKREAAPAPKAKQPNQNNRANLPSTLARPVTSTQSVAKTTPLPSSNVSKAAPKVTPKAAPKVTPKVVAASTAITASNKEIEKKDTKPSLLAVNPVEAPSKIKTTMGKETDGYGVNAAVTAGSAYKNNSLAKKTAPTPKPAPLADKGMDSREAAYVKPAVPKASAPSVAVAPEARINLSKDNKTVAATPKYDQEYWAGKRASGVSQADMKAEQDSIGMSKAYSGDKVVTADMKRKASDDLSRVTGSMATIENGGVTKTESEKYGLLNERQDTTYDYKGGPSIVTKANDPSLFGLNFGDKASTTYVDGTEVATKTGRDPLGKDAKVTRPEGLAKDINDTQDIDPVKAADEITDIDNQIKAETDPVKLKALYQRRLRLIRMSRTNTRFAGLLGEADTKKSILTSIM